MADADVLADERIVGLMKKNFSRRPEDKLSREEVAELKAVRQRVPGETWTQLEDIGRAHARAARKKASAAHSANGLPPVAPSSLPILKYSTAIEESSTPGVASGVDSGSEGGVTPAPLPAPAAPVLPVVSPPTLAGIQPEVVLSVGQRESGATPVPAPVEMMVISVPPVAASQLPNASTSRAVTPPHVDTQPEAAIHAAVEVEPEPQRAAAPVSRAQPHTVLSPPPTHFTGKALLCGTLYVNLNPTGEGRDGETGAWVLFQVVLTERQLQLWEADGTPLRPVTSYMLSHVTVRMGASTPVHGMVAKPTHTPTYAPACFRVCERDAGRPGDAAVLCVCACTSWPMLTTWYTALCATAPAHENRPDGSLSTHAAPSRGTARSHLHAASTGSSRVTVTSDDVSDVSLPLRRRSVSRGAGLRAAAPPSTARDDASMQESSTMQEGMSAFPSAVPTARSRTPVQARAQRPHAHAVIGTHSDEMTGSLQQPVYRSPQRAPVYTATRERMAAARAAAHAPPPVPETAPSPPASLHAPTRVWVPGAPAYRHTAASRARSVSAGRKDPQPAPPPIARVRPLTYPAHFTQQTACTRAHARAAAQTIEYLNELRDARSRSLQRSRSRSRTRAAPRHRAHVDVDATSLPSGEYSEEFVDSHTRAHARIAAAPPPPRAHTPLLARNRSDSYVRALGVPTTRHVAPVSTLYAPAASYAHTQAVVRTAVYAQTLVQGALSLAHAAASQPYAHSDDGTPQPPRRASVYSSPGGGGSIGDRPHMHTPQSKPPRKSMHSVSPSPSHRGDAYSWRGMATHDTSSDSIVEAATATPARVSAHLRTLSHTARAVSASLSHMHPMRDVASEEDAAAARIEFTSPPRVRTSREDAAITHVATQAQQGWAREDDDADRWTAALARSHSHTASRVELHSALRALEDALAPLIQPRVQRVPLVV